MDNTEAIKRQVKGFLTPVFIGEGPDGRELSGLDAESFRLVVEGYACAKCLALFDTYTITCPVCGLTRDLERDLLEAPSLWQEHIDERNRDTPSARARVNPAEAIRLAGLNPDVEQVKLSQLKPSRRGARRS